MDYILLYGRLTSYNNFVYQKTLIYYIYPRIMTKVNVSATVGMSATVGGNVRNSGGMSATVGKMSAAMGEIEYTLRNLRLEFDIHNSA